MSHTKSGWGALLDELPRRRELGVPRATISMCSSDIAHAVSPGGGEGVRPELHARKTTERGERALRGDFDLSNSVYPWARGCDCLPAYA
jgi:hypothetical protein